MDKRNKPPPVTRHNIAKGASEMLNIIFCFGLMVGDRIPRECKVWQYYLKLRCLVDILSLKSMSKCHAAQLEVLIEEHHGMYKDLFNKHLRLFLRLVL
jgi:hypothetical protein